MTTKAIPVKTRVLNTLRQGGNRKGLTAKQIMNKFDLSSVDHAYAIISSLVKSGFPITKTLDKKENLLRYGVKA